MTLLQTLAKLWARWFCKYRKVQFIEGWAYTDLCLHDDKFPEDCPGIKCKGCPL